MGDGEYWFGFWNFTEEEMYYTFYPGSIDRKGKIVEVIETAERQYMISVLYPEINDDALEVYYKEEYIEEEVIFNDNEFYFVSDPAIIYRYGGNSLEETIESIDNIELDGAMNSESIKLPELVSNGQFLNNSGNEPKNYLDII